MTNREFYNAVIATTEDPEIKAFAKSAIAKMDERNEKRKTTMSPTQKENEVIKNSIVTYLSTEGKKSAAEVAEALQLSSTSKASSLLRQLAEEERVISSEERVKGKGKHKVYAVA